MTIRIRTLAILAAVLGALTLLAVTLVGVVPINARGGHTWVADIVLHSAYESSVRLHADRGAPVPDLDDPDLVALGAGHFAVGCQYCHGAPDGDWPAVGRSMLPQPPPIAEAVEGWDAHELHYILYQGVMMSGMPHWPGDRTDEPWATVAWLRTVQAGEAPALPRPILDGEDVVAYCATCHGMDGRGDGAHVPRLDTLTGDYIRQALDAYRPGARNSGIMATAATVVSAEALEAAAAHYADRPTVAGEAPAPGPAQVERLQAGAQIAASGTRDVPACVRCHSAGTETPAPVLDGQPEGYLAAQLRLFRDGNRGGGPRAHLMVEVADEMTDAQIEAVATYYALRVPPAE